MLEWKNSETAQPLGVIDLPACDFAAGTTGNGEVTRYSQWRFLPGLVFLAAATLALSVDIPLSRDVTARHYSGTVRELLGIGELFGNGLGAALIVLMLYTLDPRRRWGLPRLTAMTFGAGLAADVVKLLVARARPSHFDLMDGDVWQTFLGWLPLAGKSAQQSFPSAHTATAVALAIALACRYPHGRRLFAGLALLVGVQRVQSGAHFLSDVCCGAAVGWLWAVALLRWNAIGRWFERLERRGN